MLISCRTPWYVVHTWVSNRKKSALNFHLSVGNLLKQSLERWQDACGMDTPPVDRRVTRHFLELDALFCGRDEGDFASLFSQRGWDALSWSW